MVKPKFFLPVHELLSLNGRISRLQYFIYGLIVVAIAIGIFLGGAFMVDDGQMTDSTSETMLYVVVMSAFLYVIVCLYAKRLHDLGWPAILCLIALFDLPIDIAVTLAGLVMSLPDAVLEFNNGIGAVGNITAMVLGLILTFRRGQRGPNKYGPDPLRPPELDASVF